MFLKFAIIGLAVLLLSCSRGDNYIADTESELIKIDAFIGIAGSQSKDTTVSVLDTIYLNGYASAQNSLKLKSYYWESQGEVIHSEYLLKVSFDSPGTYHPVFNIVDFYGDTLSDTLHIKAVTPPLLDTINIIPAKNTARYPVENAKFSWAFTKCEEETLFHFSLHCGEQKITDTILRAPYFLLEKNLPELERCLWTVESYSVSGVAGNSFQANFNTMGPKGFARISGTLLNASTLPEGVVVTLSHNDAVDTLTLANAKFESGIIPIGDYVLKADLSKYSDYGTSSISVKLKEGEFFKATLELVDNVAPTFPENLKDTLPYSSTLRIPFTNRGLPLSLGTKEIYLDNEPLESVMQNDTLILDLPEYNLPLCKVLKIKVADAAANSTSKKFFLCPQSPWAEIPADTTVSISQQLSLFYHEKNPYGLTATKILWYSGDQTLWQLLDDGSAFAGLNASVFGLGSHKIFVKTFYTNGLEVISFFNLEITE